MNSLLALLSLALLPVVDVVDKAPEAKDVKAGWLAFGIFLLLVVATALLCWSFVKQLRKAQAAKDAGAYGDEPKPVDPEPVDED